MYCRADYMLYILHAWCIYYVWNIHATLLLLSSKRCRPPRKYLVRDLVLETHCMADYKLYTPDVSINVLCRISINVLCRISTMYKKSMLLSYLLSSKRCRPPTKYWVRGQVLETHSMADYTLYTLDVSVNVLCRICTMFTLMYYAGYVLCLQSPHYSLTCWVQRGVDPQQSTGWGARCWRRTAGQRSWSRCCPGCWDPWPLWW